MAGYIAKSAALGRAFCAQILSVTFAHTLIREREKDVCLGVVSFLAMASCPQWLQSQTAEVSFVFPT